MMSSNGIHGAVCLAMSHSLLLILQWATATAILLVLGIFAMLAGDFHNNLKIAAFQLDSVPIFLLWFCQKIAVTDAIAHCGRTFRVNILLKPEHWYIYKKPWPLYIATIQTKLALTLLSEKWSSFQYVSKAHSSQVPGAAPGSQLITAHVIS